MAVLESKHAHANDDGSSDSHSTCADVLSSMSLVCQCRESIISGQMFWNYYGSLFTSLISLHSYYLTIFVLFVLVSSFAKEYFISFILTHPGHGRKTDRGPRVPL